MEFYTKIYARESYTLYPEGIDWEHPRQVVIIEDTGQYGVHMAYFLNKEDADNDKRYISEDYIYKKILNKV